MRSTCFPSPSLCALLVGFLGAPLLLSCSGDETKPATPAGPCPSALVFELGDEKGHADPFGAKAAGQARAGRLAQIDGLPQPAHGRQRIAAGDFVLANDKIAVFIEDKGLSDGYARFGGEILSIDKVGDDGKPLGLSKYGETLTGLSIEMIDPTSVRVLKDGSEGGEAVVRVVGKLSKIPFLQGPLAYLFPRTFELSAAYDYVLRPGEERLTMRVGVLNATGDVIDLGTVDPDELFGFFHSNHSQLVTPEFGFAEPKGKVSWVGYDGGDWSFAFRMPGAKLAYGLTVSGFSLFYGPGFSAEACSAKTVDRAEIIAGGPGYDGLAEAVRRVSGEPAFREVSGTVKDALGADVTNAWLHVVGADGSYLSRTMTDEKGAFTVHVPPGEEVMLVPQKSGYAPHPGFGLGASEATAAIEMEPEGSITVHAKEMATGKSVPVRVQVIPTNVLPETPPAYGVQDEVNGRLHQSFATTGEVTLPVPPGKHRVIVSRGYEWELVDAEVTVNAGETTTLEVNMVHSVDSTGIMCADFHIHSFQSTDSSDPIEYKVRGAIADGLDIPASSEHEWVVDFQPEIEKLGLADWAYGMASEELTTFTWGHFGIVPMTPDVQKANAGAVDWVGKDPKDVFAAVHALANKPVLIVNHPSDGDLSAYFSAASFDKKTGKGRDGFWSDDFDAVEVYNDSDFESNRNASIADYFALLESGKKVWTLGNSDSHFLRTSPVGYPRTCLYLGTDDPKTLTPEKVRDVLKTGAATVSGGLFMTVAGPNGEKPGMDVKVAADGSAAFTVTVQAANFIGAESLETIVNGKTVSVEPLMPLGGGTAKKFVNQVKVQIDATRPRTWVLFHAKGAGDLAPLHPGRKPFAASNPFFLRK